MAAVNQNSFMLSAATLMLAPWGTDPFSLIPATHSVGLSKEVTATLDAGLIELKNGIAQATVDAQRSDVNVGVTASVFEYTAKNLSYAVGLVGTQVNMVRGVLTTAAAGAAVSLVMNSDPVVGDAASAITAVTDIPSGSDILIQRVAGEQDYVFPTKSSGVATGTGPWTVPIAGAFAIPAGMSFPIGARVWVVNTVQVGSIGPTDIFGAKITGTLSNFDRPCTLIIPKIRIVKGFNLSYSEKDYGSMPFEMKPLLMTALEATGRLAEIGTQAPMKLYIGEG